MKRNGIDFFPFPTQNSTALQLIEAKFKLKGIAIYVKLLQKIFLEEGYYYKISDDVILLLKQELNLAITDNIIPELINECISRGLFDKSMYEKNQILTSDSIQREYLNAVKKRKNIELKKEYLLNFATNFIKTAEEMPKTAEEMPKTAEEIDKGKESKVKKSKHNLSSESKVVTGIEPHYEDCLPLIDKFKNETGKYVADVKSLPLGIDFNLFLDKVKKSDFLMQAKNMTLKHCLKYYDKIIAGCYDNDTIKDKNSWNIESHNYTSEEMNSFFNDVDTLEL